MTRISEPGELPRLRGRPARPLGDLCRNRLLEGRLGLERQRVHAVADLVEETLRAADLPSVRRSDVVVRRMPNVYPVYRFATRITWPAWTATPACRASRRSVDQRLFAHDNTHHAMDMAYEAADALRPDHGFDTLAWGGRSTAIRRSRGRGLVARARMSVLVSTGLGLPAEDWDRVGQRCPRCCPNARRWSLWTGSGNAENRASVRHGGLLPGAGRPAGRCRSRRRQRRRTSWSATVSAGSYAEAFARLAPASDGRRRARRCRPAVGVRQCRRSRRPAGPVGAATMSALTTMLRVRGLRAAGPALRAMVVWLGWCDRPVDTSAADGPLHRSPHLVGMLDEHLGYHDLIREGCALERHNLAPRRVHHPRRCRAAARCVGATPRGYVLSVNERRR